MTEVDFLRCMEYLIFNAKPSKESPDLLLLDNHRSYLSLPILDLAMNIVIVMLSYPPHSSHKLQLIDMPGLGPFKKYLWPAQQNYVNL